MRRSFRFVFLTRTRGACVSVVTLAAFLPLAVGCTSNEYVIPHEELARLAATPPQQRGGRVRVVQDLGDRRGDPVELTAAPPPPQFVTDDEAADGRDVNDGGDVDNDGGDADVQIDASGGGHRARRNSVSISGGGGGSRSSPGRSTLQTWHAAPGSTPGRPGGGGGGHGVSGGHIGGGGGGNGDAALVALIVVVAVVVAIGLVSSEGVRFEGYVAMSPEQPVHLRAANGQTTTIPVADLSPGWVAGTVEAKVMDDEGFGLRRLDRLPLDRRGATFKLDSGTMAFDFAGATLTGPTMNIQTGYFFTRRLGLVANIGLGGGAETGGLVPRHALGLELQAFPLAWGRVHLGAFGNGGMALTKVLLGSTPTYVSGPSGGGGALAELDLTSRLALTLRAGASLAKLDEVWTPAGQLTAGVAVY
jgi:hypothetical protein